MGKNIFRSCTFSNKGKLETSICSAGQSQRHGPPLWFGPIFSGSRLRETAINGGGEVAQKPSTTPNRESFRSGRRSRGVCVRFELGSFAEIESRRGGASHGDESTALVAKDDLPVASIHLQEAVFSSAACGCRSQAVSLASLSGCHPSCQARLFFFGFIGCYTQYALETSRESSYVR